MAWVAGCGYFEITAPCLTNGAIRLFFVCAASVLLKTSHTVLTDIEIKIGQRGTSLKQTPAQ